LTVSATLYVLFFFQAEDGIRDRNVTGVQTCALPISLRVLGDLSAGEDEASSLVEGAAFCVSTGAPIPPGADAIVPITSTDRGVRSEERRVGKEGRSRWARSRYRGNVRETERV